MRFRRETGSVPLLPAVERDWAGRAMPLLETEVLVAFAATCLPLPSLSLAFWGALGKWGQRSFWGRRGEGRGVR